MKPTTAWLPDWKDDANYPSSGEDLSLEEWAWEFLRRNPEFQNDYYNHRDTISLRKKYGLLIEIPPDKPYSYALSCPTNSMFESSFVGEYAVCIRLDEDGDPDIKMGHSIGAGLSIGKIDIGEQPLKHGQTKEFDLANGRRIVSYGRKITPDVPGVAVVKLDLRLPLPPQLMAIETSLTSLQQHLAEKGAFNVRNPRKRLNKFPVYLRVLDAEACGVSISEMTPVLNKDAANSPPDKGADKTVRKWLNAAHQLSNIGYRFIPLPRITDISI